MTDDSRPATVDGAAGIVSIEPPPRGQARAFLASTRLSAPSTRRALERGGIDVLWNPPWVSHGVQNLTESIAVSMWWFNVNAQLRQQPGAHPLMMFLGEPNPIGSSWGSTRTRRRRPPRSRCT